MFNQGAQQFHNWWIFNIKFIIWLVREKVEKKQALHSENSQLREATDVLNQYKTIFVAITGVFVSQALLHG